jgi:hypothetical protein
MRVFYTLIGLALDVFDWLIVGMIPLIGDIVDLAATVLWLKVLGPVGLAAAVELIPAADILPTNIALGIYADYRAEAEK